MEEMGNGKCERMERQQRRRNGVEEENEDNRGKER